MSFLISTIFGWARKRKLFIFLQKPISVINYFFLVAKNQYTRHWKIFRLIISTFQCVQNTFRNPIRNWPNTKYLFVYIGLINSTVKKLIRGLGQGFAQKNFRMFRQNLNFTAEISIFGPNFDFWPNFRFLSKFRFLAKISFFVRISIFPQNLDFCRIFNFWQKLRCFSKFRFFFKIFNVSKFGQNTFPNPGRKLAKYEIFICIYWLN